MGESELQAGKQAPKNVAAAVGGEIVDRNPCARPADPTVSSTPPWPLPLGDRSYTDTSLLLSMPLTTFATNVNWLFTSSCITYRVRSYSFEDLRIWKILQVGIEAWAIRVFLTDRSVACGLKGKKVEGSSGSRQSIRSMAAEYLHHHNGHNQFEDPVPRTPAPPPPPPHVVRIANPAPRGLCGFALTTFVLSCYNAGIFGISVTTPPNVVVGLALFYGGVAQLLAGMWEFKTGNTFGATAFSSYGAFWLAWAVIQIPGFGVKEAYADSGYERDFVPAVATFLLGWTIFTFMMWLGTLKANFMFSSLFFNLTITFMLLTISDFRASHNFKRAGGFFGIITACNAWYIALAGILTHENSYFTLPVGNLARHR